MFNMMRTSLFGRRNDNRKASSDRRRFRPQIQGLEARISLSGMTTGTYTNGAPVQSPIPTQWSGL